MKQDGQHFVEIRYVLVLLLSAFGVFGLWAGCFTVLLADLSRALGLSPGPLGVALFAGAAASIVAMALLGWSADRFGRKAFLVVLSLAPAGEGGEEPGLLPGRPGGRERSANLGRRARGAGADVLEGR